MFKHEKDSRPLSAAVLLAAILSGCAAKNPPLLAPVADASLAALRSDLSALFNAPQFERLTWGVSVRSIDRDERLFELNSKKLLMPASTMKILTLAAAAERLGWDYRIETRLVSCAPIEDDILKGDLIAVGGGDPTIGDRADDALEGKLFDAWAGELANAGIRSIDGRLIGDDNAFDDAGTGDGWPWDDLAYSYAAPVSALTYDSNAAELLVRPADAAGESAKLTIRPFESDLTVDNNVTTSVHGGEFSLELRRSPGTSHLIAHGAVPLGMGEFSRTVSVDNPTDFFVTSLRRVLLEHQITVMGTSIDIDKIASAPDVSTCRVLASHHSAPLSSMAASMMKMSLNLYAETLLKILARSGSEPGTTARGLQAVRDVLQSWGIALDGVALSDGSGLSRYSYVAPDVLVALLAHIARDPRHAQLFAASLPVAGQDGTLANRLKGTVAEGNVRAKTGTLTGVRAVSGYVRTRDGEQLAFSIIVNGSNLAAGVVDATADRALERLANFRRDARARDR